MNEHKSWWHGIVQGLVALGLGLYLVISPTGASLTLGLAAAVYLVVMGILHTMRGLNMRSAGQGNILWIRGLIALVVGAALLIMQFFNLGSLATAYTILAIGLIAYGALGLFTDTFQRGDKPFEWGPILVNLALLAWGVLVFYARARAFDLATVSGWILTGIGAVLLIWTFLRRPRTGQATA